MIQPDWIGKENSAIRIIGLKEFLIVPFFWYDIKKHIQGHLAWFLLNRLSLCFFEKKANLPPFHSFLNESCSFLSMSFFSLQILSKKQQQDLIPGSTRARVLLLFLIFLIFSGYLICWLYWISEYKRGQINNEKGTD